MKNKRFFVFDLICVALLCAFGLAIGCSRWRSGIDWGDEGFLAYGAVRVLNGEIPHRDFVSLQPPLSFYSVALIFKLFGASLVSLRGFGLIIFLGLPLLVYGIARCLTKPLLALAAAAPACVLGLPLFDFVPFAVWQGIAATLLAAFLYLRTILRNRSSLAFASGVFAAISLFLRQDQAIYFIVAASVLAALLRFVPSESRPQNLRRIVRHWAIGLVVTLAPLIIYFWAEGAAPEMWRQLVMFPATVYRKTSALAFPSLTGQAKIAEKAAAFLFYLPPCLVVLGVSWLVRRVVRSKFSRREAVMAFLIVWSALFYLQTLTRSDLNHLFIALPPFFLLSACGWDAVLEALGKHGLTKVIASTGTAVAAAAWLWVVSPLAIPKADNPGELIDLPAGGVRIENGKRVADFIRDVQRYVPPDRSILSLPYQPMLYFLCQRRDPTRWNYIWPGDQTALEHRDLIAQARRDPPAVIFITGESEMNAYAGDILEYVHKDYRRAGDFGRLTYYLPNEINR